jgi:hypothetical protein
MSGRLVPLWSSLPVRASGGFAGPALVRRGSDAAGLAVPVPALALPVSGVLAGGAAVVIVWSGCWLLAFLGLWLRAGGGYGH